jgi:hypothetical protein
LLPELLPELLLEQIHRGHGRRVASIRHHLAPSPIGTVSHRVGAQSGGTGEAVTYVVTPQAAKPGPQV